MDELSQLRAHYTRIKDSSDVSDHFDFEDALLESDSEAYLQFHYALIAAADCDSLLFEGICRKFKDRGTVGENYLLQRIQDEPDDEVKARALQILGGYKFCGGKRLKETAELARQFMSSTTTGLRCRALWVIGWLGSARDLDRLAVVLHKDAVGELRGWAATAMMQIFFNHKAVASKALSHLKTALEVESDLKALEGIVVSIQEISGKRLGLSASSHEPPKEEKLKAAIAKASRLLKASTGCSCPL